MLQKALDDIKNDLAESKRCVESPDVQIIDQRSKFSIAAINQ